MLQPIEWTVSKGFIAYPKALEGMERRVAAISRASAPEQIWLLEHEPMYTAGTSARFEDLLEPERFPVYRTGRGGQFTYHGPGQRVAYVMMDLNQRGQDIRKFVWTLEQVIIETVARFGVEAERREGRIGVWVLREDGCEEKIAAIGVRIRHWVSFHGLALNVDPDLSAFEGIVPCGLSDYGVTSLSALGVKASMSDIDNALRLTFEARFGPLSETIQQS